MIIRLLTYYADERIFAASDRETDMTVRVYIRKFSGDEAHFGDFTELEWNGLEGQRERAHIRGLGYSYRVVRSK